MNIGFSGPSRRRSAFSSSVPFVLAAQFTEQTSCDERRASQSSASRRLGPKSEAPFPSPIITFTFSFIGHGQAGGKWLDPDLRPQADEGLLQQRLVGLLAVGDQQRLQTEPCEGVGEVHRVPSPDLFLDGAMDPSAP